MSKPSTSALSRRSLFAGAGTAGALAAGAALLPRTPVEPPLAEAQPVATEDANGRYRATAHVMRYYQTAKV